MVQAININTVRCHDEDAEDVYTSALELDRAQNVGVSLTSSLPNRQINAECPL